MSIVTVNLCEGIATVALNRPDHLNALNPELLSTLRGELERLAGNAAVHALVVTGTGRAFCSGADLTSFLSSASPAETDVGKTVSDAMEQSFNPLIAALMSFPKPVISAINGIAAGGGAAIALCADVIIAARTASLKFVQVQQLGCVADLGGNWFLQRAAGRSVALASILLGETIPAERACQLGLVWEVVNDDGLMARAQTIAQALTKVPQTAVIASRKLVDLSAVADIDTVLELERLYQRDLASRPELVATVRAFLESRKNKQSKL